MMKRPWIPILMVSSLLLTSCGSDQVTYLSTTPTSTFPVLEASISMQGGTTQPALVEILTSSNAVTNAVVTLTSTALNMPLTLSTAAVTTYQGNPAVVSFYTSANTGWTYTPTRSYTMTVSMNGSTYHSALTAVGGVNFATGSSGVTATWTGGISNSNGNPINVTNATATETSSPFNSYNFPASLQPPYLVSPFTIPASSLSGHTSGNYSISLTCENFLSSAFPGTNPGSFFMATDSETTTY